MIEFLQLRGMSERTQQMYVRAVRQLAEHYRKSPDNTEEELRQYFLYIKNVKKWSRSGSTIALCGIKFFFERTLEKEWTTFTLVRPPREQKLPVILSLEEVRRILQAVRLPRYRVCLSTIYSCGLRLQEGTRLQVCDIDSARRMIHVRHGNGGKDRYVPLPERMLELLRGYWLSIAIRSGSSQAQVMAMSRYPVQMNPCAAAACRTPSARRSKQPAATKPPPSTRFVTMPSPGLCRLESSSRRLVIE
jgi:integrase/recombinase XerD